MSLSPEEDFACSELFGGEQSLPRDQFCRFAGEIIEDGIEGAENLPRMPVKLQAKAAHDQVLDALIAAAPPDSIRQCDQHILDAQFRFGAAPAVRGGEAG